MNIFNRLKELNYPIGHYVVVNSGVMAVFGIREARDLDIAVYATSFEKLKKSAQYKEEYRHEKLFLMTDDVEISS